ncbi:hypothetical protein Clacol_007823 [Clathrus columnatus]|uniref:Uncharacterized protein n=1 Tax=Clathrus columnatus TaxID=1419009 RepID=A0AAV5AKF0_9AGAM|nr:hypothetical protein Clacol_007823 [Clathrus columnatus]
MQYGQTAITPAHPEVFLGMVHTATIILLDVFAFSVVIYQAWGLINLQQSLGFYSREGLVKLLLRQGILRFSALNNFREAS